MPFKVRNPKYKPKSQKFSFFFFFFFFFLEVGVLELGLLQGAESSSLPTLSCFPFFFGLGNFISFLVGMTKLEDPWNSAFKVEL